MENRFGAGATLAAIVALLLASPASAQKNYTDGGDLYGGSHPPPTKESPAKQSQKKSSAQRSGKFDPYTEGTRTGGQSHAAKLAPEDPPPLPDNVAKTGKFDPYTDGRSKSK